ncbi:charged multivesicular body protein 7 [Anopheles marshallii]|uniref:charged multivesicular body protein 7 n=1 Tax=Anopheles marshallii TaxID=1521116 RepID=UPI00237A145E|nr:charged multivesicular body protein 7 [Anopheles marshallii]
MEHKAETKKEVVKKYTDTSYLPECWSDDRRMGILLAEFRPRQLNAASYDAKMKFWKDLIHAFCSTSGCSVVSISLLKEQFRRKGTVPYCLHIVLADMLAKGELCKESQLKAQQRTGAFGFNLWTAKQFVKAPILWGYEVAVGRFTGMVNINDNENFIVTAVTHQHSKMIENIIAERELTNKLLQYEYLVDLLKKTSSITRHGVEPAVDLLEKCNRLTKQTIVCGETSTLLIKFAGANAIAQPITSIEKSIYELEESENRLMEDINMVEHSISQTMDKVREYIKDGRKQMAKTYLKKKNYLEKNMQGKINALENLQGILLKIHNCQSDKNIIEAYKLGTNALKNAYEAAGITIDQLDETMDEMRYVLEQHDEMSALINTVSTSDVDELELEQELGDLIDMKLAESKINTKDFPTPPSTSTMENNTVKVPDFDKEIEKRLAALRVDGTDGYKLTDHGL